jgi:hypothetical protein
VPCLLCLRLGRLSPKRVASALGCPGALAGDITNPQSLNRYAYVLNNPMTLTDPLGLQEKSNLKLQVEPTTADCTLNGIYMSCSVVKSVVGAGAAVACTSVNCGGLRPAQGPAGTTEWQRWVAPVTTIVPSSDPSADFLMTTEIGHWEVVGRVPDFWQFAINVGPWWGGTFQVTIDRYNHVYIAPGVNIGKSLGGVSVSLSSGWMGPWNELPTSPTPPTPNALRDFLTKGGCSAGGMFGGGLLAAWSSGGQAWMPSVGNPQAGISCGYGFSLW